MKAAVAYRPDFAAAADAAHEAGARMRAGGHEVVDVVLGALRPETLAGVDLACVFGGDGTMLHASRALAPLGIPLLGVNLGHLGFLTMVTKDELDEALRDVVGGRYQIEERAMLEARLARAGREMLRELALNDVVVARGAPVRSIHVAVSVDGDPLVLYWADGVIAATATGSTAYAFSAGGPLLLPTARSIALAPIAPHLSFANSFVFEPDQVIDLEVQDEPARISIDGQLERDLAARDRVTVRRAATVVKLVRTPHARPFLSLLRQKILKEPVT